MFLLMYLFIYFKQKCVQLKKMKVMILINILDAILQCIVHDDEQSGTLPHYAIITNAILSIP